jgi:N-methylhydantoinase A/oxoprolinase/acetone carboxylase beta subunit
VTDANLLLGRLIPAYFPQIFGKSEKEPLDIEASRSAFEILALQINDSSEKKLSFDEIVYGYAVDFVAAPPFINRPIFRSGSSKSQMRQCVDPSVP